MQLTPQIQRAINFSAKKHCRQKRNDKLPFIVHPFSVAWILSDHCDDQDTIAAAFLHDILEDVEGYSYHDMVRDFGKKIADIVKGVTEPKISRFKTAGKLYWRESKQGYLDNLRAAPKESILVAAADKIHNLRSMIGAYNEVGDKFWKRFVGSPQDQVWFYREAFKVIQERIGREDIVKELERDLVSLEEIVISKET
ncbi:MAG: HD domain-containing protein [Candidatus Paceibacterota bacterium]|jgi:(p)ppGpp synthase/HD superfamily hydrolase